MSLQWSLVSRMALAGSSPVDAFSSEKILPIIEPLDGRIHLSASVPDGPTYYVTTNRGTQNEMRTLMINTVWLAKQKQHQTPSTGANADSNQSPLPPSTSPSAIPPVTPTQAVTVLLINVSDYGAKGDGVTNDSPAIQAAIDAAPVGSTLVFQAGKRYLLNRGLVIHKAINVQGNGATLIGNTSDWPYNTTLNVSSALADKRYAFGGSVTSGQTSFTVSIPTSELKAGDYVYLSFGNDPNDPAEEHYATVARVISNNGTTLVVDKATPYTIKYSSGGVAAKNFATKVTSLVQNVSINGLVFATTRGKITDMNLAVSRATGVTVEDISGSFTNAVVVIDSSNITVRNIRGTVERTHWAAGEIFSTWQSDGVTVSGIDVTTSEDQPVLFFESWARNITLTDVTIRWNFRGTTQHDVIHVTGGSSNINFDRVNVINPNGAINLVDQGGQGSSYHFGVVTITGAATRLQLDKIDDLTYAGKRYANAVRKTVTITIQKGSSGGSAVLTAGTVKSINLSTANNAALLNLWITNTANQGVNAASGLRSGDAFSLEALTTLGTRSVFNTNNGGTKTVWVELNAPAASTYTVTIDFWYYL